jgi:hypothetical protein
MFNLSTAMVVNALLELDVYGFTVAASDHYTVQFVLYQSKMK